MPRRDVIAIGGSLGALEALRQLCRGFQPDLTNSMFIVVHIGRHGNNTLASLLQEDSPLPVTVATDHEPLQRGHIYVAPADHHLLVLDNTIRLGRGPRENMARPAIDPLLRSIGISYGPRAIGLVLTGLLNDGASGLADLKRCGGVTVVQNPSDARAPDMPLGALSASSVDYRAPLQDLAPLLTTLLTEDVGTPPPVAADIRLEVEIALGRPLGSAEMLSLGDTVPLSCPACGGVLSQMRSGPVLRFRCQVGHAYTADTLTTEKESSVDEALRVAMRIMEERQVLMTKMVADARQRGFHQMATDLEADEAECRQRVEVLRRAVLASER